MLALVLFMIVVASSTECIKCEIGSFAYLHFFLQKWVHRALLDSRRIKREKKIFACKVALLLICMYVASRIAILNDGLLVVSRIYEKRH